MEAVRRDLLRRAVWALLAGGALAVLVAARAVTPSAAGIGTHRMLGLPPCAFYAWSGLPCPTCGLTTAFAHAARLQLGASLRAHPLGLPLFALTLALVPYALVALVRAASPAAAIDRLRADRVALYLVLGLGAAWLARIVALTGLTR